jgi:hypothetical protein
MLVSLITAVSGALQRLEVCDCACKFGMPHAAQYLAKSKFVKLAWT